ncbi:Outer membrane protein IcsA autotransporter [Mixta theicola]|nr:Outer membrane protein IcsA autotransporter [Mixta theicola]
MIKRDCLIMTTAPIAFRLNSLARITALALGTALFIPQAALSITIVQIDELNYDLSSPDLSKWKDIVSLKEEEDVSNPLLGNKDYNVTLVDTINNLSVAVNGNTVRLNSENTLTINDNGKALNAPATLAVTRWDAPGTLEILNDLTIISSRKNPDYNNSGIAIFEYNNLTLNGQLTLHNTFESNGISNQYGFMAAGRDIAIQRHVTPGVAGTTSFSGIDNRGKAGGGSGNIDIAGTLNISSSLAANIDNAHADNFVGISNKDGIIKIHGNYSVSSTNQRGNDNYCGLCNTGTIELAGMHSAASYWRNSNDTRGSVYHIYNTGKVNINGAVVLENNNQAAGNDADNFDRVYAIYSSGETIINASSLAITGKMVADGGTIDIANHPAYSASLTGITDTLNGGVINLRLSGAASRWNMSGDSHISNLSLNGATLSLGGGQQQRFQTLTVEGNYRGDDALIEMNTRLGDDGSPADRLLIKGDAAGKTYVRINNVNGAGALTQNGIELIRVEGVSSAEFKQQGRVTAGLYEYFLRPKENSWYLTSQHQPFTQEAAPEPGVTPQPTPAPTRVYHPESGSYIANRAAMNSMFSLRYADRAAQQRHINPATGEDSYSALWLRQTRSHSKGRDGSGQLSTRGNTYTAQLGSDLLTLRGAGQHALTLGAFAGYGNHKNSSRSALSGYGARGQTNGYSLGLYAGWTSDADARNGAYVDTWLQHGWFTDSVKGDDLDNEKYKAKGFLASLEGGYHFNAGAVTLTPNAQLIYQGLRADAFTNAQGSVIQQQGNAILTSHLGARLAVAGQYLSPYMQADWIHNTEDFAVQMDGNKNWLQGGRDLAEMKVGGEIRLSRKLAGKLDIARILGTHGYRQTSGMFNLSYLF